MATLKSWAEVQASPEFRNLTPAQQQEAARAYNRERSVNAQMIAQGRSQQAADPSRNAQGQQTGLMANVGAGWDEFQAGLQTMAADVAQQNNLPHMTAYLSRLAANNRQQAEKVGYAVEDISSVGGVGDYLYGGLERTMRSSSHMAANMVPYVGTALSGASMYGNILDQQKQEGNLGEVNRPRALAGAIASTLLDRVGMRATGLLGSGARTASQAPRALPNLPRRVGQGLATESVTEGVQTGIEGVAAGSSPDVVTANMQEAFLWGPATGGYMTLGGEASRAAFGGDLGSGEAATALNGRYDNLRQNGKHADPISMNRARIAVDAYDAYRKDTGASTLYNEEVAAKATAKIQELWEDTATANAAIVADEFVQAGGLLEHFMMPSEKRARELGIEKSTLRSAMRGVQKATGIDLVNAIDDQYNRLKELENSKYRDLQNLVAALDNRHRSLEEAENTLKLRKAAGIADTAELAGVTKQLADLAIYKKQVGKDIAKANGLFVGRDKVNDPNFTVRDQQDIADLVSRTGLDFLTAYQQHSTARAMREATDAERRKFYGSRDMAQAAVAGTVGFATGGASIGVGLLAGGIDKLSSRRAQRRQSQTSFSSSEGTSRRPDSADLIEDYGIVPEVTEEQIATKLDAEESRAQQRRDKTAERKATEAASAPKFTQVDIDNFQDDISTKIYTWDATRDALLEQGMTPEHYNEFQELQEEMDALQESEYTVSHPNKLKNLTAKLASVRDRAKQDISENNRISTKKEQRDARTLAASEREKVRQRREQKAAGRSYDTAYNAFLKDNADKITPEQRAKLDQRVWDLKNAIEGTDVLTPEQFKRELMDIASGIKAAATAESMVQQAAAKAQADADAETEFNNERSNTLKGFTDRRQIIPEEVDVPGWLQTSYEEAMLDLETAPTKASLASASKAVDNALKLIEGVASETKKAVSKREARAERQTRKQEQEDKETKKKDDQAVKAKADNSNAVGKALNDFLSKEGKDLPDDIVAQLKRDAETLQASEGIVSVEDFRFNLGKVARAHRSQQDTLKMNEERSTRSAVVATDQESLRLKLDSADLGTDADGVQRRQEVSSLIDNLSADMPKAIYSATKAQINTLLSAKTSEAKKAKTIRKLLDLQASDFRDVEQGVNTLETQDKLEEVLAEAESSDVSPESVIQEQLEQAEKLFKEQTLLKDAPEAINDYRRQLRQLEDVKEALQEDRSPEQARERLSTIMAQRERDMEATRKFRDVEEAEGFRAEESLGKAIEETQKYWTNEVNHALDLDQISKSRAKDIQTGIDELTTINEPKELNHQRNLIKQELKQAREDRAATLAEEAKEAKAKKKPLGGNQKPATKAASEKPRTKPPVKAPKKPETAEPVSEEAPVTVEEAVQAVAETPVVTTPSSSTGTVKAQDLAPSLQTPTSPAPEAPVVSSGTEARSAYKKAKKKRGNKKESENKIEEGEATVQPEPVITAVTEGTPEEIISTSSLPEVPAGLQGMEPESRQYTAQDTVVPPDSLTFNKRKQMDAQARQAATKKVINKMDQEIEQELMEFRDEAEAAEPTLSAGEFDLEAFERVNALMRPKRIALYENAANTAEHWAANGGTEATPPEVWLDIASHWRKALEAEEGTPTEVEPLDLDLDSESAVTITDDYNRPAPVITEAEAPQLTTEANLPPVSARKEVVSEPQQQKKAPSLPPTTGKKASKSGKAEQKKKEEVQQKAEEEDVTETILEDEDADTLEEMGYDSEAGNVDVDGKPIESVLSTLESIEKEEGVKKEDQFLTKADKEALKRDEELNASNATDEDVFAGVIMLQRGDSIFKPVPMGKSPYKRFPLLSETRILKKDYPPLFKKYKESIRDMGEDYLSHLSENDPTKRTIKKLLEVRYPSTKDGLIRSYGSMKAVKRLIITKLIKDAQDTKKGSRLFKTATGAPNGAARRSFINKFVDAPDATASRALLSKLERDTRVGNERRGIDLYTGKRLIKPRNKAEAALDSTTEAARWANYQAHRRFWGLDKPETKKRKGALSK